MKKNFLRTKWQLLYSLLVDFPALDPQQGKEMNTNTIRCYDRWNSLLTITIITSNSISIGTSI